MYKDIPTQSRELVAYPVFTTKPYANIKKVDVNRALTFEGVVFWVDYRDAGGSNLVGAVVHDDEELFLSKESTSCGQIIGFILGETQYKAMAGAKAVHVEYEDYDNPIQDALQYGAPVIVERENFTEAIFNKDLKRLDNNTLPLDTQELTPVKVALNEDGKNNSIPLCQLHYPLLACQLDGYDQHFLHIFHHHSWRGKCGSSSTIGDFKSHLHSIRKKRSIADRLSKLGDWQSSQELIDQWRKSLVNTQ